MGLSSSAPLSIKGTSGSNRDIALEVDGNDSGTKSLWTLGGTSGLRTDHISVLDFLGYSRTVNVTYSMAVTTPYSCTPMGAAGWNVTMSHNVTLTGLPVGNTVSVNLRFYGGMTFQNPATVTYSVYANIYRNSVLQPSYVTTGYFGSNVGDYYFMDTTYTLMGITSSDSIIVDRIFSAQQNPDGDYLGWWGSSLCSLTISNPTGVPINLIGGATITDLSQPCN